MNVTQLLTNNTVLLDIEAINKQSSLSIVAAKLKQAGKIKDEKAYVEALLVRESQGSTGVGGGIAIPHAKTASVIEPAICFARFSTPIAYDALDDEPIDLMFMIAAPNGANNLHLEALSRLATYLMDEQFTARLRAATSIEEVIQIIDEKEVQEVKSKTDTLENTEEKVKILAVTACPTGIAHTYMAAEKLEEVAREKGYVIKVETNGSSGVKNELTAEEIEAADAIIVAADTKVEMVRFNGKPVIQVPVSKAIYHTDDLLEQAVGRDVPIYNSTNTDTETEKNVSQGIGAQIYKHLMNGVSNMLPFVVGGGILIALSFFWGVNSADPSSSQYNEFAYMLKTIGGENAFHLMVPVLAGFIAMSIADRPGFAPGMVGGLLAITITNEAGANSGFLGGLIAGFLAGYIVQGLKVVFAKLPKSLEGIKPILLYPLFGIGFVGIVMMLLNPQLTKLYTAFSDLLNSLNGSNIIILGIVLAAMMAFDLGGPLNKAAYTFGVAMLDTGNHYIMAAVMAGGMVPPLGVAVATTLFKNKFTKQERDAGKTSYVLGASFISEGAIPFAASDPLRMIPSFMIGAAVSGALTMAFHIGLPVPHGGIFVIGLIDGGLNQALLYILAILVGTFISALLIGLLKKQKVNTI